MRRVWSSAAELIGRTTQSPAGSNFERNTGYRERETLHTLAAMMTTQKTGKTNERNHARRGLVAYLSALVALSVPLYAVLMVRAQPVSEQMGAIAALMWVPTLAMVVARVLLRERHIATGLTVLNRTVLVPVATALAFPIVIGAVSYGAAWALGLASFAAPAGATGGFPGLASAVVRAVVVGAPLGIITVVGEEIGWRGYMAGRLREAGLPVPDVIGGLVWAAWHAPLILTGQYAAGPHALVAVLGFVALAIGLHALWSHWLFRTGSLWPAIIGHSAWNVVIQHPFDGYTAGEAASLWVGDSGLLTAGLCLAVALIVVRFQPSSNYKETGV